MLDNKPSEPKIDIKALKDMLEEVIDNKLGEHETRLIDGFKKLLKGDRKSFMMSVKNALNFLFSDIDKH